MQRFLWFFGRSSTVLEVNEPVLSGGLPPAGLLGAFEHELLCERGLRAGGGEGGAHGAQGEPRGPDGLPRVLPRTAFKKGV